MVRRSLQETENIICRCQHRKESRRLTRGATSLVQASTQRCLRIRFIRAPNSQFETGPSLLLAIGLAKRDGRKNRVIYSRGGRKNQKLSATPPTPSSPPPPVPPNTAVCH